MRNIGIVLLLLLLGACGTVQQGAAWMADQTEGTIDTLIQVNEGAAVVAKKQLCEAIRLDVYLRMFPTKEQQDAHKVVCRRPEMQ